MKATKSNFVSGLRFRQRFSTLYRTFCHNFRVPSSHPGTVFVREYSDSEEVAIKLLKPGADVMLLSQTSPSLIVIPGLDLKRQWYLYENIRCNSTLAADITCPKPPEPKPSIIKHYN